MAFYLMDDGSSLQSVLSTIEEAQIAVSGSNCTIGLFNNTRFNANNVSVLVENSTIINNCTVEQCIFESKDVFTIAVPANLIRPYLGRRPETALRFKNCVGQFIGRPLNYANVSALNYRNYFRDMNMAIDISNTTIEIYNNDFTNIFRHDIMYPPSYAINALKSNVIKGITVGDFNVPPQNDNGQQLWENIFYNCDNGININGSAVATIVNNKMNRIRAQPGSTGTSTGTAINLFDANYSTYDIHNNFITNFGTGIWGSLLSYANIDIHNNNFNIGSLVTAQAFAAIRFANPVNALAIFTPTQFIYDNSIRRVTRGIVTTNWDDISITDNSINLTNSDIVANPGTFYIGINANKCQNLNIARNYIYKDGPNPTSAIDDQVLGINGQNITTSTITSNLLSRMAAPSASLTHNK
ncbi:MAG: hypothetical protein IPO27_00090 [Bacteroidetes bacterium]|nr:hypothetical protein [Bacteroidota bacterium]